MTAEDVKFAFASRVIPARYLTEDLAPIGGQLKQRPEDFLVEEIPLYEPCGEGEHIYLFIEKRNLSTLHLVRLLARHFGVRPDAVGYAGLKDKYAVTRQMLSVHVPGRKTEDFGPFEHRGAVILWLDRHTNKLRSGHLRGNRFSIRIRGVSPTAVLTARKGLDILARVGVPNRFAEQRFGSWNINHLIGRAIILGDHDEVVRLLLAPLDAQVTTHTTMLDEAHEADEASDEPARSGLLSREHFGRGDLNQAIESLPNSARTERRILATLIRTGSTKRAAAAIDRQERSYFITAFQSAIFNVVLDVRLLDDALATLQPGDVAWKHDTGAAFDVTDDIAADAETRRRLDAIEISPSGPMWGAAMKRASASTDHIEVASLHAAGFDPETLTARAATCHPWLEGARRALRIPLKDHDVEGGIDEHGAFVRCTFELPRGAFATAVLREIMKPERCGSHDATPGHPRLGHRK